MAKIVVVTSGKGGVGKTTTSASFSSGLAMRGFKTAVIDFDVGLRNLDLIMGCERRVVYDLINVINGEANLNQALIKDKQCENLFVLPASQTRDKDALSKEGVEKVLQDLAEMGFDYIICDSPAGIETGAGLGEPEQVLAGEHGRDGLCLDRCGRGIAKGVDRLHQGVDQVQLSECGQVLCFHVRPQTTVAQHCCWAHKQPDAAPLGVDPV